MYDIVLWYNISALYLIDICFCCIYFILNTAYFVLSLKGPVIKYLQGGVEDILGGYVKKSEPLRGGTKILVDYYLNLGGYGKKLTFIIMLNIKCIYIQI